MRVTGVAAFAVLALVLPLVSGANSDMGTRAEASVIQFGGPPTPAEKDALHRLGIPTSDYLPPYGYVALLDDLTQARVRTIPGVIEVRALAPSEKLSGVETGGVVQIALFPGSDVPRVVRTMARSSIEVLRVVPTARETLVIAKVSSTQLRGLLALPNVRWVEPARYDAVLDNAKASALTQGGTLGQWPLDDHGVNGSSQLVAYCDSGLNTDAPLAKGAGHTIQELTADPNALVLQNVPTLIHRKVALYYAPIERGLRGDLDDAVGHGTHVGGTIAGDAGAWGVRDGNDGVAIAARLVVCDASIGAAFQVLDDYANYWQPSYDAGARIHSNSWGTVGNGTYSLKARQHDAYAWDHRDFLILRSAGNDGPTGPMRAEALAKDVLAIGSTTNNATPAMSAFSARGPTSDGRLKPDIVAPGDCVTSGDLPNANSYTCLSGTSQATAVAAGAATLVRDYYAKGYYPGGAPNASHAIAPSAALVRATLLASTVSVGTPLPDAAQGWGRIQLDDALYFQGDTQRLIARDENTSLDTGDAWNTSLAVTAGGTLRVVLAWTDAPAAPGASPTLVNDLDLQVIAPDGTIFLGNALVNGVSVANATTRDERNVVEQVIIPDAQGNYSVRIVGHNVPVDTQSFAFVAVGKLE